MSELKSRTPSKLGDLMRQEKLRRIPKDPAERLRLAIEVSELCLKLRKACLNSSSK